MNLIIIIEIIIYIVLIVLGRRYFANTYNNAMNKNCSLRKSTKDNICNKDIAFKRSDKYPSSLYRLLRDQGLWWVFLPTGGFKVYHLIKPLLKKSTKERRVISNYAELWWNEGVNVYELSRSGQISMLMLILIVVQVLFFNINDKPESFLLYGALISMIIVLPDKVVEGMCEKRQREIESIFPEFLSRVAILIDAGTTVRIAIRKIVEDSDDNNLYKELRILVNDLDLGKGEANSFENFSKRCNTPTAAMFTSVVLQNLKKGNKELSSILRIFAGTAWRNRKNSAIKRGEEAAAKLMLPMMIIFIAIMILLAAPAIMQMSM